MSSPPIGVYVAPHLISQTICQAFARGLGEQGEIVPATRDRGHPIAVSYGILRGCGEILQGRLRSGKPFVYVDKGYLSPQHYTGYYRVSWSALHTNLAHGPDFSRLGQLAVSLTESPRGIATDPVLVIEPSDHVGRFWGFDSRAWSHRVVQACNSAAPRRPVIVCTKENEALERTLARAWAVVVYQSNIAVRAVLAGKLVFVAGDAPALGAHPVATFGNTNLGCLQYPQIPERRERQVWLAQLAATQFRLDEMARGDAWRWLRENAPEGIASELA